MLPTRSLSAVALLLLASLGCHPPQAAPARQRNVAVIKGSTTLEHAGSRS